MHFAFLQPHRYIVQCRSKVKRTATNLESEGLQNAAQLIETRRVRLKAGNLPRGLLLERRQRDRVADLIDDELREAEGGADLQVGAVAHAELEFAAVGFALAIRLLRVFGLRKEEKKNANEQLRRIF